MASNNQYDLEDRTLEYAKRVRDYIKTLPKSVSNHEYGRQMIRSSGSVGANYIEANESLSKKDFAMRIKISRKEARETKHWLKLSEPFNQFTGEQMFLINESTELTKIFTAILNKV